MASTRSSQLHPLFLNIEGSEMNATRYRTKGGNVVAWKPTGEGSPDYGPKGDWECKGCHVKQQGQSRHIAESHAQSCNAC